MKNYLLSVLLFLSCSPLLAGSYIHSNTYTTNTDTVVDARVSTQGGIGGTNAVTGVLGFVNGNTNGGGGNFFLGGAGNPLIASSGNVGFGPSDLTSILTGTDNTGYGYTALQTLTSGSQNTAVGRAALIFLTTGNQNIALGRFAGQVLTSESGDILIGHVGIAGESNTVHVGTSQTDVYLSSSSASTTHVAYVTGNGFGLTNTPKIFTVTNVSPTSGTTSLAQATLWLVITNNGTAYRVPAF